MCSAGYSGISTLSFSAFSLSLCAALLWACGDTDAPKAAGEGAIATAELDSLPCGQIPAPPYYIPDYPCPPGTINGWIEDKSAQGPRFRVHAWHLFAGVNDVVRVGGEESFRWRTWKTSTDLFPGQYGGGRGVGEDPGREAGGSLRLAVLPGGRLENPGPETPGRTTQEIDLDPDVDRAGLSLPNGPVYDVPTLNGFRDKYQSCLHRVNGQWAVEDGKNFQSNGDVMVAGVIYDTDWAATSITEGGFWDAAKLDGLLPQEGGPPTSVWMKDNSIVLKPMLWPVPGGEDEYVALPLWDANEPMSKVVTRDEVEATDGTKCETYSGFERKAVWKQAVALNASPSNRSSNGATVSASYLHDKSVTYNITASKFFEPETCRGPVATDEPIVYKSAEVVSLDRFYTERFSNAEWSALGTCDRAVIDQSSIWALGREFDPEQDALVLIAMHIMTKERTVEQQRPRKNLSGWTFQTAWWSKDASTCGDVREACGGYARFRPTNIPSGPWSHYLIATSYGNTQSSGAPWKSVPLQGYEGNWPVVFNPYIELAATHPVETNCINCHNRAGWPGRSVQGPSSSPRKTSSYLAKDGPSTLRAYDISNPMFDGLLTLDSMWAISDRAYYPKSSGDEAGK